MGTHLEGQNFFGITDYATVCLTFALSMGIGLYYSKKSPKKDELLVGERNFSTVPIATSMLVTYVSAIAVLGNTSDVYARGLQIFTSALVYCIAAPLSIVLFVGVFYRMRLTSVYEYFERRFDSVVLRWLASLTFIVHVVLQNGLVLYAPSIALETFLGLPVWISLVGVGVVSTVYTSLGGIKAVVWTDFFQFFMIAFGLMSITIKGFIASGGIAETLRIAGENGRLQLFRMQFDPFEKTNFWNIFFGYGVQALFLTGIHAPQVQRYCSLPSFKNAKRAILLTIPLKLFTMGLLMLTGISVFSTYAGCSPLALGKVKKLDYIVPYFVVDQLNIGIGLMGLFVSCIFAATLSTISSTLNSLAAVVWTDFLSKISYFQNISDDKQSRCIRLIGIVFGILSIIISLYAKHFGSSILYSIISLHGVIGGTIGGTVICGMFIPKVNKYGAGIGLIVGFISMMGIMLNAIFLRIQHGVGNDAHLPYNVDQCPEGTDFSKYKNFTSTSVPLPWPTKIYTISVFWYTIIGCVITVLVAVIVSFITRIDLVQRKIGGNRKKVARRYVHHWVYWCSDVENENTMKAKGDEISNLITSTSV